MSLAKLSPACFHNSNTSIAANEALSHHLHPRTACKMTNRVPQNGQRGLALEVCALPSTFANGENSDQLKVVASLNGDRLQRRPHAPILSSLVLYIYFWSLLRRLTDLQKSVLIIDIAVSCLSWLKICWRNFLLHTPRTVVSWLQLLHMIYTTLIAQTDSTSLILPHLHYFTRTTSLQGILFVNNFTWTTIHELNHLNYYTGTTIHELLHLKYFTWGASIELFQLNYFTLATSINFCQAPRSWLALISVYYRQLPTDDHPE